MAASASTSAAAVGDVVATAAAGVERAIALAAALVECLRMGLFSTAGTVAFGGAFLVGIMAASASASAAAVLLQPLPELSAPLR